MGAKSSGGWTVNCNICPFCKKVHKEDTHACSECMDEGLKLVNNRDVCNETRN